MRTKICAELGTAHHGNLETAQAMIQAAANAGCDAVKVQHYGAVNPKDPQADWLNQSRLHIDAIKDLCEQAHGLGLEFWATPFDKATLKELESVRVNRIKIASSESAAEWWYGCSRSRVVSYPWGQGAPEKSWYGIGEIQLTAIPMYPTPLECAGQAKLLDGWSDHVVGTLACQYAIMHGAQWLEVHLKLPGVTRERDFEKTPDDFRQLRRFAEDVETMRSGVSEMYRSRWSA